MSDEPQSLMLLLSPEDGLLHGDAWQTECERLSRALRSAMSDMDVTVRPRTVDTPSTGDGRSRGSFSTFSNLVVSGIQAGTTSVIMGRVWDTVTDWMKRRAGCRCVIKLDDGSEFHLENLTKTEALKLLKSRELRRPAGGGRTRS